MFYIYLCKYLSSKESKKKKNMFSMYYFTRILHTYIQYNIVNYYDTHIKKNKKIINADRDQNGQTTD